MLALVHPELNPFVLNVCGCKAKPSWEIMATMAAHFHKLTLDPTIKWWIYIPVITVIRVPERLRQMLHKNLFELRPIVIVLYFPLIFHCSSKSNVQFFKTIEWVWIHRIVLGRIIDIRLDAIAELGVSSCTHRKIAEMVDVPLGAMTYYYKGIQSLIMEAFTKFADQVSPR